MRPVILHLEGFASFRASTRVDFSDADFFALVGPTGSGKSTIIDAMTFALYGSVPRWGRKGMVSLALAPTTTRGTVKLVFEAGGQRYVVARELRRLGGQVGQRAASLERISDPGGLAEPGEPTELLAKDRGVAEAVERLLGLSYEDFCQCVVLPQGQFAAFLHAKASERQEILLRLLGAERYQQIMQRANQRTSEAAQRAGALTETLAAFGDATQEAEDAAREAEAALAALGDRMSITLPGIHSAAQELAAAGDELARLEREEVTLAAVQIPGDVANWTPTWPGPGRHWAGSVTPSARPGTPTRPPARHWRLARSALSWNVPVVSGRSKNDSGLNAQCARRKLGGSRNCPGRRAQR